MTSKSIAQLEKAYKPSNSISFYTSDDRGPTLVLSEEGFVYNGKVVKDGGEAYDLFTSWLKQATID